MTTSAIPDLGRPVMVNGLRRVWGSGLVPLVTNFRAVRMAGREVKLAGTALDMVLDSRAMSLADVGDDFGRHSKFERGIKALSDRYGLVSIMAPWNAALKQWAGTVSSTRILEEATSWRAGTIKGANKEYLAMLGIDASRADKIAAMFDEFGERHGEVWIANTERWTDRDALRSFRAALAKDVDRTIVTPGVGDRPLWMSKEWGKTVGQFKSFVVASAQRVLLSGLQQRDMATLNGAMLMVGLGMGVTAYKNWEAGREQPEDLGEWIANGVDRSGLTGWFFDVNNIAEKATRGAVGLSALTGNGPMSRYANRNTAGAIVGPTAGAAKDMFSVTGALATGDWWESDVHALRRLLPYQNLFYARWLFDEAEAGLNETLGAKQ
ncbi:MAG: hypothetical protein HQL36_01880 [Alphaproteobacteria bacterium]|nr:hypothetical protein [Alphaproteobacteria bacterium]